MENREGWKIERDGKEKKIQRDLNRKRNAVSVSIIDENFGT
jgi:hypothetical protein